MSFRLIAVGASLLFVAAACSDSENDAADNASESNSPTDAVAQPVDYTKSGEYAAGVVTFQLPDPGGNERPLEVWYPVDPSSVAGESTEVFDVLQVFPENLQEFIPDEISGEIDTEAHRDAPAADGSFPVVIYSHGFGGYRQVFTNLATHLATHGFIVASADHLERGLVNQALGQLGGEPDQDVTDVENTIALLGAENDASDSVLAGIVDLEHIGITGHSAGAGTSARAAAALDDIDAFSSISGGAPVSVSGDDTGIGFARLSADAPAEVELALSGVTDTAVTVTAGDGEPQTITGDRSSGIEVVLEAGAVTLFPSSDDGQISDGSITVRRLIPPQPSLVLFGELDETVPADASRALYEQQPTPKVMVGVAGAGHNSFTDTCRGILDQGGLQSLVDLIGAAQVARAEDGCTPAFIEPEGVQAAVRQASAAFFLGELTGADTAASISDEAVVEFSGVELSDYDSAN